MAHASGVSPLAEKLIEKRGTASQAAIAVKLKISQPSYCEWEKDVDPGAKYYPDLRDHLELSFADFSMLIVRLRMWRAGIEPFEDDPQGRSPR